MIVGAIRTVGNTDYVVMNKHGTLQRLPRLKWWRRLVIVIMARVKNYGPKEVLYWYKKMSKNNSVYD